MKTLYLPGLITIALVLAFHTPAVAQQKEQKRAIPHADASTLHTEIEFPVGNLRVSTTSGRTTKCIFQFRKDEWKPQVQYNREKESGYLEITSGGDVDIDVHEGRHADYDQEDQSNWGLLFPEEIPHELDIEMVAGKADIELENSQLKDFEFSMVAGEAKINLRNTSVPDVDFKALAGETTLDLSGNWSNNLHADIQGGFGSITLKLPSDVGVEMEVSGILGGVSAPRMRKDGNNYINKAFGKTPHNLYLDISGGIGDVSVEWVGE